MIFLFLKNAKIQLIIAAHLLRLHFSQIKISRVLVVVAVIKTTIFWWNGNKNKTYLTLFMASVAPLS